MIEWSDSKNVANSLVSSEEIPLILISEPFHLCYVTPLRKLRGAENDEGDGEGP